MSLVSIYGVYYIPTYAGWYPLAITFIVLFVFAFRFPDFGVKFISGGSDYHLFTPEVRSSDGFNGKIASETLQKINITVNKTLSQMIVNLPL